MKKRTMSFLLILLCMSLLLTGCGSKEMQLMKCARAMYKADSFRMRASMELGFSISGLGQIYEDTVDFDGSGAVTRDPLAARLSMSPTDSILNSDIEIAVKQTKKGYSVMTSMDGGDTWTTKKIKTDQNGDGLKLRMKDLPTIANYAKTLEVIGTKKIRGSEATGYIGKITGEQFADILNDDIEIGDGLIIPQKNIRKTDGFSYEIWIDNKTNLISKVSADFTDMSAAATDDSIKDFLMQVIEEQLGEKKVVLDALGVDLDELLDLFEFSITELTFSCSFNDYNKVNSVNLP